MTAFYFGIIISISYCRKTSKTKVLRKNVKKMINFRAKSEFCQIFVQMNYWLASKMIELRKINNSFQIS